MNLTAEQRNYLLIGQGVIPFAFNFVLNGLIGFFMFRGVDPVPTWGVESSAGPDLIATCFFLPAITCLIVTPIVRHQIASGAVAPASGPAGTLPGWLLFFQRGLMLRTVLFGLGALTCIGGLVAAGLLAAAPAQIDLNSFLWLKAAFSGALGGSITPFIGLVALAEGGRRTQ